MAGNRCWLENHQTCRYKMTLAARSQTFISTSVNLLANFHIFTQNPGLLQCIALDKNPQDFEIGHMSSQNWSTRQPLITFKITKMQSYQSIWFKIFKSHKLSLYRLFSLFGPAIITCKDCATQTVCVDSSYCMPYMIPPCSTGFRVVRLCKHLWCCC